MQSELRRATGASVSGSFPATASRLPAPCTAASPTADDSRSLIGPEAAPAQGAVPSVPQAPASTRLASARPGLLNLPRELIAGLPLQPEDRASLQLSSRALSLPLTAVERQGAWLAVVRQGAVVATERRALGHLLADLHVGHAEALASMASRSDDPAPGVASPVELPGAEPLFAGQLPPGRNRLSPGQCALAVLGQLLQRLKDNLHGLNGAEIDRAGLARLLGPARRRQLLASPVDTFDRVSLRRELAAHRLRIADLLLRVATRTQSPGRQLQALEQLAVAPLIELLPQLQALALQAPELDHGLGNHLVNLFDCLRNAFPQDRVAIMAAVYAIALNRPPPPPPPREAWAVPPHDRRQVQFAGYLTRFQQQAASRRVLLQIVQGPDSGDSGYERALGAQVFNGLRRAVEAAAPLAAAELAQTVGTLVAGSTRPYLLAAAIYLYMMGRPHQAHIAPLQTVIQQGLQGSFEAPADSFLFEGALDHLRECALHLPDSVAPIRAFFRQTIHTHPALPLRLASMTALSALGHDDDIKFFTELALAREQTALSQNAVDALRQMAAASPQQIGRVAQAMLELSAGPASQGRDLACAWIYMHLSQVEPAAFARLARQRDLGQVAAMVAVEGFLAHQDEDWEDDPDLLCRALQGGNDQALPPAIRCVLDMPSLERRQAILTWSWHHFADA